MRAVPTMKSPMSQRVGAIQPFQVVEMLARAKALEAQGRDIVHMQAGEPDFTTAPAIIEAGIAALTRGETQYSDANGLWSLRQAIADYYRSDYGVDIDPKRVMITPGASGALLLISALLVDRGRGVLMTDPGYPCNSNFIRLMEGESQLVPVGSEHGFQLTDELVNQYWRQSQDGHPPTVAALVASPANPTGAALSREALGALFKAVDQQGGQLVVDEIYHGLDFRSAGTERAITSIVELTDQAFVINSFSKYFGMTGWRLGWLVAPEWALPGLEKLAQNLFISMSTMAQYAALQCFTPATRALLDARRDEFQRRCDVLLPALEAMGFIIPHYPEGGLYIYADISGFNGRFGADSQAFCHWLLEEHGIALTPGADFGDYRSENMVRFAFTTSLERITFAIEKMQRIFMV